MMKLEKCLHSVQYTVYGKCDIICINNMMHGNLRWYIGNNNKKSTTHTKNKKSQKDEKCEAIKKILEKGILL